MPKFSLNAGTRLGLYEILSPLGRGGMGEVYRARDTRLKRDVAIKGLSENASADVKRSRYFDQEARSASISAVLLVPSRWQRAEPTGGL
jgi:serine/threonine protein kinase